MSDCIVRVNPQTTSPGQAVEEIRFLVFADDWGRHPSSCQHLFSHLAKRYEVDWVNTIGTRAPRIDLATLRRGVEKLTSWTTTSSPVYCPARLRVHHPKMWPWFRSQFDRWLNRRMLVRQLSSVIRSNARTVVVTTLPITADLVGALPAHEWVYYCVDDFGAWPGLDQKPLRKLEQILIERVDRIIAVSAHLQDRITELGRQAELLTHGVDLDHWTTGGSREPLAQIEGLPRPLVVFWGVIDRRMDVSWIESLRSRMSGGTIVLAGPLQDPDPVLLNTPGVVHVPPLPFESLPRLAHEAAVLIMPYADLPVTRAMQPLKLKEYLATGKPVVVSDLPANRPWHDCLDLVISPESFTSSVLARITSGLPLAQANARERLASESWESKARQFEQFVFEGRTVRESA